ncbi:hypothetical protein [uncultured Reyranella sp.]|uniref:hypothetical protein n=1 Tax=uncultured Reyranella sp. TaxID=735512 RepID=UPI0025F48E01|nr:hypothetical protein [uncultured Reyranella sp.]
MPICEIDPWRTQYFAKVACPAHVFIPTEDSDAWLWNPQHRWTYDKLAVATRQGLEAAPHGVAPKTYPVFSKPVYNLKGMGVGSRALRSQADYEAAYQPGHMWMPLLDGEHISSDVALVDGAPRWWRHAAGIASGDGTFDSWEIRARPEPAVESCAGDWCRQHLAGYTGMVNLETIGGRIIEMHLRFSDQWPDLYGEGWVEALVRLYAQQEWLYEDRDRRTGYSVVLFMPHGRSYYHPPPALLEGIERMAGVSSVQITFHESMAPEKHAMPPGGFRVAIINCWHREAGNEARSLLRDHFSA